MHGVDRVSSKLKLYENIQCKSHNNRITMSVEFSSGIHTSDLNRAYNGEPNRRVVRTFVHQHCPSIVDSVTVKKTRKRSKNQLYDCQKTNVSNS